MSSNTAREPRNSLRRTIRDISPEHPPLERLAAYQREQLAESEAEEIQEHFLSCAKCRQTLLALSDFLDGVAKSPRWNPEDLVAAWRELQVSLPIAAKG